MKTVKVRFLVRCEPQDGSGRVFEQDSVHTLREDAARHWLTRNKAEVIMAKREKPKPPAPLISQDKDLGGKTDAIRQFEKGQEAFRKKALEE